MDHIIFIDNPSAPRQALVQLLSDHHYQVVQNADFAAADAAAIVLVDATGMDAAAYLGALYDEPGFANHPLIVLADAPPATVIAGVRLAGWLVAPFDEREVLGAVRAYVFARSAFSTDSEAELRQQLEHAQQECATLVEEDRKKDEFISYISHELKNPMASIKGYADLMRRRNKAPDDPNRKGLEIISTQVGRMTLLLDQMLDFSRINLGQIQLDLQPINMVQLAQRLIEELQPTTQQHALQLVSSGTSVIVVADEKRLRQALQYLLSNAIKFSPASGTIVVSAAPDVEGGAKVAVSDKGMGIPAGEQKRVFERFYRASNVVDKQSGLGLGLYLAREIITRHGGRIDLVSQVGEGSTFTIQLPAAIEQD